MALTFSEADMRAGWFGTFTVYCLVSCPGCGTTDGDSSNSPGEPMGGSMAVSGGLGGTAQAASGGNPQSSGLGATSGLGGGSGVAGTGGMATGGNTSGASGGAVGSGGSLASGGNSGATGGISPASGGATETGGTAGSGGGGPASGGQSGAEGGTAPSGGAFAAGGTGSSGGAFAAGGTPTSGGAPADGGTNSAGWAGQEHGLGGGGGSMPAGGSGGAGSYSPCPTSGDACRILPFGDSITDGVASSDLGGYRSQLFALVVAANQNVTFIGSQSSGPAQVSGMPFPKNHEGHSGWTIEPGYSSYGSGGISSLVPSPAFDTIPHIVLLMIGTNDVTADSGQNTMADRLGALLDKIVLAAPDALIVLAQLTPVSWSAAALDDYNAKIPGLVEERSASGQHIVSVDMHQMPLSALASDGVHPGDQGYAYMADVWYGAIKDVLPQ